MVLRSANHMPPLNRPVGTRSRAGTPIRRGVRLPGAMRPLGGLTAVTCLVFVMLASGGIERPLSAQNLDREGRRIIVSLDDHRLWLVEGSDTLLAATVAVGRRETFRYAGKVFDWRTPRGERVVTAKRRDPVWRVPDWHYYERVANEGLDLVKIVPGARYPLEDGSHLEVRGRNVVRVLGERFWAVPQGREIIIDGVLYVPPFGTLQREVPEALGTRALYLGDGYLIHGTTPYNRSSIGGAASHGCVRMENDDVERLFEMVNVGTPVLIR
jgi:lipoprotein-anchoring transpeptidase ErfK/SrfK